MADSLDSGSSVHYGRAGSSPASRTKNRAGFISLALFFFAKVKASSRGCFLLSRSNPLRCASIGFSLTKSASFVSLPHTKSRAGVLPLALFFYAFGRKTALARRRPFPLPASFPGHTCPLIRDNSRAPWEIYFLCNIFACNIQKFSVFPSYRNS